MRHARDYFILMGDIIASGAKPGDKLSQDFHQLIEQCNRDMARHILSPYTITLGDEFQGVGLSLQSVLQTIFYLEEAKLRNQFGFHLRMVMHHGVIETPINTEIAHGMLGPGLTQTRKLLNEKQGKRFVVDFEPPLECQLVQQAFDVCESIMRDWRVQDFKLIADMIESSDNTWVGERHGKNRSQIWKRRKSLRIEDYLKLRSIILDTPLRLEQVS